MWNQPFTSCSTITLCAAKSVRANDRDPYIEGAAAPLVRSISGLDSGEYEHPLMSRAALIGSKQAAAAKPAMAASAITPGSLFSTNCFNGTETDVFSNNANGSLPIATYKGNVLNLQSLTSNGCAYTPPPIQTAYNLTGLYAEGFDGSGQTIGIIDWCGSLTIQSDANAFSAQFGLPRADFVELRHHLHPDAQFLRDRRSGGN